MEPRHLAFWWMVPLALITGCDGPRPEPKKADGQGSRSAAGGKDATDANSSAPVIIVGGGLAGLVTAYELQKKGISSHILEAADTWGGRVATADYGDGLRAEYGMQEIWTGNPLLQIARELGVPIEAESDSPYTSVIIDGKLRPFVQETADEYFASFLDERERAALKKWLASTERLRALAEQEGLRNASVARLQDISFATWVKSARLPHQVEELIRLTIECELAADWDSFSGVIGLLEFAVFLGPGSPARHVVGGNARLIDALVAAHRGPKTLSVLVTKIDRRLEPGRIRATVTYQRGGRLHTVAAERVVVAVPFFRLHQIAMDPPLSSEKWDGILTLGRGQYTVVHLLVNKAARKLWEINGQSPLPILSDGVLGVIYGVNEESPPEQPLEVFTLLIHGKAANGFHMVPRELKTKELLAALDRLWPGFSGHVATSHVYTYHPAAIAVWPPGRSPLDDRSRALAEPEMGLHLVGDWTLSGHADGAVRSGMRAAAAIAKELAP